MFGASGAMTSDDEAPMVIDFMCPQEKTGRRVTAVTTLGGKGTLMKSPVIGLAYERYSRP